MTHKPDITTAGWQSIKTLPKVMGGLVGSEVILVTKDGLVFEGHIHLNGWAYSSKPSTFSGPVFADAVETSFGPMPPREVTHWMPLPRPPVKEVPHD